MNFIRPTCLTREKTKMLWIRQNNKIQGSETSQVPPGWKEKKREIRNWSCNRGNPCYANVLNMAASQEMVCILLFDELSYDTRINF